MRIFCCLFLHLAFARDSAIPNCLWGWLIPLVLGPENQGL